MSETVCNFRTIYNYSTSHLRRCTPVWSSTGQKGLGGGQSRKGSRSISMKLGSRMVYNRQIVRDGHLTLEDFPFRIQNEWRRRFQWGCNKCRGLTVCCESSILILVPLLWSKRVWKHCCVVRRVYRSLLTSTTNLTPRVKN